MAIPQYATEQLIANVKRTCAVPTSQLTYSPADFTALANDELQSSVVPLIMATREEYFVTYVDVPVVGNEVEIPDDAVGQKLRSVCFVQATSPMWLINIPRIDLDVVAGVGFANNATMSGFYVQGNKIVLYPSQSVPQNTTIRLYYYKRTLVLADPSAYGQVLTVDSGTNTITLSFVPNSWETGTQLNSIAQTSPFNATNALFAATNVSSPSIVCDSVEGIAIGDYVSEYGYSAIPQIPIEAQLYLAQLTAVKALEGLGDREGMRAAQINAESMQKSLLVMISQRVDGSVKKVINPNGGLRSNSRNGRWGCY